MAGISASWSSLFQAAKGHEFFFRIGAEREKIPGMSRWFNVEPAAWLWYVGRIALGQWWPNKLIGEYRCPESDSVPLPYV